MGQTLTHGVYLPDEGERNCYNGLAANWQLLDNSVGTIAEHTSQIAGKAPAVHTHTKSDITDFPAFGNAAGTICEGNDSRLSDARTPVAHTHTKSDVTDLFYSANTWTEHNTYARYIFMKNTIVEIGKAPSNNTSKEISFTDKNNETLSRLVGKAEASGNSYIFLHATNKYTNEALDPNGSARHSYFYVGLDATGKAYNKHAANTFPDANNTYDLGSSSYQWNNVYSKNYYYNGTEFQSKFVTLDTEQLITGLKRLKSGWWRLQAANLKVGAGESYGRNGYTLVWTDRDDITICDIASYKQSQAARTYLRLRGGDYYTNGVPDAAGTLVQGELRIGTLANGSRMIECYTDAMYPGDNNTANLGTETNKWKTFNGINPGALSLPNIYDSYDVITTNWNTSYSSPNNLLINGANPSYPGWLFIRLDNCTQEDDFLIVRYYHVNAANLTFFGSFIPTSSSFVLSVPIQAGITTKVWVSKIPTTCKYYACLGTIK